MDLKALSQLGRLEKEFEINDQLKVKLHTPSNGEQQSILLTATVESNDALLRYVRLQVSTLVYATTEINGQKYPVNELQDFYSNLQHAVLNQIYDKYSELADEQGNTLESLKKKI